MTKELAEVDPAHVERVQQVFQAWQQGNQQGALDLLADQVDRHEPWAVGLAAWLRMQQGIDAYEAAAPLAIEADALGMPWVATQLFNNAVANAPSAPQLARIAADLASKISLHGFGVDPIASGWNLIPQGQPEAAVRMMATRASFPSEASREIASLLDVARTRATEMEALSNEAIGAIEKQRVALETKAKQAGLLVSSVNSDAVNALFDAEAERYQSESQTAWKWGLRVLAVAAFVAVLPLVLHYVGWGADMGATTVFGAHLGSTLALGAVAGVLLARARGRDRAHQKARDLSTAMGTMISYSNQISDETEKQNFMLTMGQLVFQAHLQRDHHSGDDSLVGAAALLNAMRVPPSAS